MSSSFDSPSAQTKTSPWQTAWRDGVDLLASMRFAIALLSLIGVASVMGTIVKQNEPWGNYVNQFGLFWAEVFQRFGLFHIYSATWFLLILAFLVISTSLCIARNAPKIVREWGQLKEGIRAQSLLSFGHKAQAQVAHAPEHAAQRMTSTLAKMGWRVKTQTRNTDAGMGMMVAAKTGSANKLGYIAAHSAVILVCIGGLLDGDMMVRLHMWLHGKQAYTGQTLSDNMGAQYRLADSNPTFRGNVLVAEGQQSATALLNQPTGVLLQDLPFGIELKKFIVDYYSTGMPKVFASDIVIHDRETGAAIPARVEVNHPASYKGIDIFQSSFQDGGSHLTLKAMPLLGNSPPVPLQANVGQSAALQWGKQTLQVELTDLRTINVENFANTSASNPDAPAAHTRWQDELSKQLGAADKTATPKVLRNVGPSFSYKLRDAAGQAIEYTNYMLPIDIDGTSMFLLGMREAAAAEFRYLRIPADEQNSMTTWLDMRNALMSDTMRAQAVRRYVAKAVSHEKADIKASFTTTATKLLDVFAGTSPLQVKAGTKGGVGAVLELVQASFADASNQEANGQMMIGILADLLTELHQLARQQAGLSTPIQDEAMRRFVMQAMLSLGDVQFYPAPMVLMLDQFEQVQASVFQVARAPGKKLVYLGCFFLIVGIFAMLFIRERRLWVWLTPSADGQSSQAILALSCNRNTSDTELSFEHLKTKLLSFNSTHL
jgi:cytochrome c biogenesis protein